MQASLNDELLVRVAQLQTLEEENIALEKQLSRLHRHTQKAREKLLQTEVTLCGEVGRCMYVL